MDLIKQIGWFYNYLKVKMAIYNMRNAQRSSYDKLFINMAGINPSKKAFDMIMVEPKSYRQIGDTGINIVILELYLFRRLYVWELKGVIESK